MLYAVASQTIPSETSSPSIHERSTLFRSRAQAEASAQGRPILAVALRFDPARGRVVPEGPVARGSALGWSAPASIGEAGAVTIQSAVPDTLVRAIGRSEVRAHPGLGPLVYRPHIRPRSLADAAHHGRPPQDPPRPSPPL